MLITLLPNGDGHGLPIPFHPFLVNFTAGLVPVSFLCDALGVWLKKPALLTVGWWTLLVAAIVTPLTAAAGWYWMLSLEHAAHWQLRCHQWLGVSFAVLLVPLAVWRGSLYKRERAPGRIYAAAAIVLVAALTIQAELGASMSFGRGFVISPAREYHADESLPPAPATQPSGVQTGGHQHQH